jgi:hypothetical protein
MSEVDQTQEQSENLSEIDETQEQSENLPEIEFQEWTNATKRIIHEEVVIMDKYYGYLSRAGNRKSQPKFIPCGRAVEIAEIHNVLESNAEWVRIVFYTDPSKGTKKEAVISRENLYRKNGEELLRVGIDAQDQSIRILFKLFQNQELTARRVNVHTGLGFNYEFDPVAGRESLVFKAYRTVGAIKSTYAGEFKIEPQGSYADWLEMVNTEVIGNSGLELGLVMGFVGMVRSYLRETIGDESLLVNYRGDSTTGKTTTGMLSVSAFGLPDKGGLSCTWNATDNALEGMLNGNYGFPIMLDEQSTKASGGKAKTDFTKIIYVVHGGQGKQRLNRDATLKKVYTWCTVVISTSEESMYGGSSQNTGIRNRLVEINPAGTWTVDARNAEAIKSCVRQNYGHAGPMVAESLMVTPVEDLLEMLEDFKLMYVTATSQKDEFTDRVSVNYGLILLTAHVVKEILGLNVSITGILDFLLKNERENYIEKDIGRRAYDHVLEVIATHPEKFGSEDKCLIPGGICPEHSLVTEDPKLEIWGKRVYMTDSQSKKLQATGKVLTDQKVIIAADRLNSILSDKGFADPQVVLKSWKKHGWLDHEEDRYHRKQRISRDGDAIKVYVILIEKSGEEMKETQEERETREKALTPKPKGLIMHSKSSKMRFVDNILEEDD